VILKALAKEPDDRYANGAALVAALRAAARPGGGETAPPPALSVADRVALDMGELPPPPASQAETIPPGASSPAAAGDKTPSTMPAVQVSRSTAVGGGVVLLLLLLLLGGFLLLGDDDGDEAAMAGATTAVSSPTLVATEQTEPEGNDGGTAVSPATATATSATTMEATEPDAGEPPPASSPTPPPPTPSAAATIPPTAVSDGASPTIYLPVIARQANLAPVAAAATATAVPPSPASYILIISRDEQTLFFANQSQTALPLEGLRLTMEGGGDKSFSQWGRPRLAPNACLYMSKKANASTDIEDAGCASLVENLLLFDWKENFTVFYNDIAAGRCRLQKNSLPCVLTLPTP
jgi:hypothetical protein